MKQHDVRSDDRTFNKGDSVFVKNFQSGDKWLPGVISQRTRPVLFVVELSYGRERCCHQVQLQKWTVDVTVEEPIETETQAPHANTTEQSSSYPEPSSTVPNSPYNRFQQDLIHHLERLILLEVVLLFKGMNQYGDYLTVFISID